MTGPNESFRDLEELPQFPAIATKLLRVLSHDNASVQEIGGLIRADAALASAVLRMVNSALYAVPTHVTSIERALLLLGFDELKRLALALSVKSSFHNAMRLDLMRRVWRHCLACAMICDELSVACSPTQSRDDGAYTAGLLHDIGRLALFAAHPTEYSQLLTTAEPEADILECERRVLGADHCQAGAWLAKKWELPLEIGAVAAGHHDPPVPEAGDVENLVRVGVLLTESLGFDIRPPRQTHTMRDIRTLLPRTAQFRFDPPPDELKARITSRLDAWD
jgi:putative nucleotidyltransferase with HDIG domain